MTRIDYNFQLRPNQKLEMLLERDINSPYSTAGVTQGTLDWKDSKTIIFQPLEGFTGNIEFSIHYQLKGVDNIAAVKISVNNIFKPRARIIKIIGQELISNDVIALVELIKNSYDADAENIEIQLNNIFDYQGEILVKDDGIGMDYEKVINVWLEPATPDKRSTGLKTYSNCYNRRFLGEKGIGRFAVHRLGEKIELVSRAKVDCNTLLDYETTVVIDWSEFTEDKYLSEIPIHVEKSVPITFQNSSGTLIRITKINPWKNLRAVKDAVVKIKGLESPIVPKSSIPQQNIQSTDPGFNVNITSTNGDVEKAISEIKSLSELLNTSFYRFNGVVDEAGNLEYEYSFSRPDYRDVERISQRGSELLTTLNPTWFEERPLTSFNTPGRFEVNFYAWDLETAALRVAGLADYYRNVIKPNAGIRIYRDNFRVWPYGESEDDWLGLDLKRLNSPKERSVSRNQVFGIIHISSISNDKLVDQSNREGLIINEQYDQFYELVQSTLSVFAKERKKDKVKIDKVSQKSSVNDIVTESLEDLRRKFVINNHSSLYEESLENISNAYTSKINDVLERYMMAAAIGISYSIPIHEMKLRLSSIKSLIDDLNKHPELQDKILKSLSSYVQETDDIVTAVTSMMSRQKMQKVNLRTVAENVFVLKEFDLKKHAIIFNILGEKELFVEAVPGLLNTAVLNLVDNAIYWLRAAKIKFRTNLTDFTPFIDVVIFRNDDGRPVLRVKDNGEGISDPFELLIEPYYSRKSDGLGLGLFLVNDIIKRFNGNLSGYNDSGAVFDLIF